jgi:serine-type D-Ala-D-Ala carboxypeptidase/endopeptidase
MPNTHSTRLAPRHSGASVKRPSLVMLIGLATLLGAATPALAQSFPSDSAVLAIIRQRVEEKRSVGIVVGLVEADGRTRVIAFGDPGPGKLPLDANTVFEIGSISKVFTSTLLAQLVLEGKVALDDPVQKFLPAGVTVPTRNGKVITLGNLAMQNSGLPRLPTNFKPADVSNPYADYTVQQMYDFLSGYTLPRDPGEQFEYSNLGVGLLGHALALSQGKSYEQLQRERIWLPLGMTHTAITLTPWMTEHLALGHDPEGEVTPNWDLPTLAGAGAIRSTTTDMLAFLAANVHPDRGPLGKAMALAQQERGDAGAATVKIGLNWILQHLGADTLIWHNGGTGGYRSFAGFVPSRKMGVVVLTNSGGAGADDIGMHLLVPRMPLAPKPAPPKERSAIALTAEQLAPYVGTYQLAPEFAIEITLKDGALFGQATGQGAFQLWPETASDFFIREVDAQIRFLRNAEGIVTSMVLHQGGQDVPGKKVK